jgi:hypothetical protein
MLRRRTARNGQSQSTDQQAQRKAYRQLGFVATILFDRPAAATRVKAWWASSSAW